MYEMLITTIHSECDISNTIFGGLGHDIVFIIQKK